MNEVEPSTIRLLLMDYLANGCLSEQGYDKRANVASQILNNNFQNAFKTLLDSRKFQEEVKTEIGKFWGRPLDLLELQVQFSREAASIAGKLYAIDSNQKSTRLIYGRSCQIAAEILLLLKGGFSDGAEARWRTLYELDVISSFICSSGNNIGERYLAYEAKEMQDLYNSIVIYYEKKSRKLSQEEKTDYKNAKKSLRSAKKDVEAYCKRYGESFKNNYGWAAEALGKKKPNFADIQERAGYFESRVLQKAAHFAVHGGPRAALYRRGWPELGVMLMGPSVYGLKDIINNTAIALDLLNLSVYSKFDHYKILAIYDFQSVLVEEIMKSSASAEKTLGPFQPQL